jgi:hypothetical protein
MNTVEGEIHIEKEKKEMTFFVTHDKEKEEYY